MSQYDPTPFEDPRFTPRGGTGAARPPKKKGGNAFAVWAAVIVGGGLLAVVVCCGGTFGVAQLAFASMEEDVRKDLAGNPVVNERLGGITAVDLEFLASADHPDEDVFIFDLTGPKGTGRAVIDCGDTPDGGLWVRGGTLELPDGTSLDLFPDGPPAAGGGFE